jgi:hypothetical protein
MKKVISILLVFSIIGGSMHLDELVKVPLLVSHYFDHKKSHPGISVSGFLYMHYILNQKPESEKDKKSDSQLPFKSVQNFHCHFVPFVFENEKSQMVCESVNNNFITCAVIKVQSRPFDIWQPPKI